MIPAPRPASILKKVANSTRGVVLLFVGTILVWSVGWMLVEGSSFADGIYWTITTMTTVGYGDMSPDSAWGKVATSVLMLWSVFGLVPILVGNLVTKVIHNPHEWTHDEQELIKGQLAQILQHHEKSQS